MMTNSKSAKSAKSAKTTKRATKGKAATTRRAAVKAAKSGCVKCGFALPGGRTACRSKVACAGRRKK